MGNLDTKRFGRYEILGELGRGAMGVVYKARDPQIDRLVALKTVALRGVDPEAEEEFRQRFLNEAQAAGRLHHPGIVAVFDVGEESENHDPYIVLEFVDGEPLNKLLAREKKLPLARALALATEVAEALHYAHGQGVTHRDIKPGNILITQEGRAKIADFGIAKLNLAHFTLPGRVLGTPAYMAPEQLSGEGVDGRSDLFSLGVILYAMVTGHSPFPGSSATTVCFKVANREPVAASVLDLSVPRELDAVIARAMQKDPEQRYQTGAEFAADLGQLQELGVQATGADRVRATATAGRPVRIDPALNAPPAVGLAYGAKLLRRAAGTPPIRDLILGTATVALLAIIAIQSKLFLRTQEPPAAPVKVSEMPGSPAVPPSSVPAHVTRMHADSATALPATRSVKMVAKPPAKAKKPTIQAVVAPPAQPAPLAPPAPPVVVPLSMVELQVRHQFKDATLTVYVDDHLALTRVLHGGTQKKLVVFGGVHGIESETLKVEAGRHLLRFRARSGDQTLDLSKTISADLIGGDDKTLLITFEKRNTSMRVEWQ